MRRPRSPAAAWLMRLAARGLAPPDYSLSRHGRRHQGPTKNANISCPHQVPRSESLYARTPHNNRGRIITGRCVSFARVPHRPYLFKHLPFPQVATGCSLLPLSEYTVTPNATFSMCGRALQRTDARLQLRRKVSTCRLIYYGTYGLR